jgi:hypothetical protein
MIHSKLKGYPKGSLMKSKNDDESYKWFIKAIAAGKKIILTSITCQDQSRATRRYERSRVLRTIYVRAIQQEITTKHAERKVSLQSFEQEGVAADA